MNEITKCERHVMVIIWSKEEAQALAEIMSGANERFGHDWKPQTVSTFLARLRKKGYLDDTRKGRYVYYTPKVSKEMYQNFILQEMKTELFDGDVGAMKCMLT